MDDNPDIALYMPLLRRLASRSRFVIELGPGDGNGSLRALSEGLRLSPCSPLEKLMISVELRGDRPKERPADPFWNLIHGDSADDVIFATAQNLAIISEFRDKRPRMKTDLRRADLIFIDTAHTYEQLSAELGLWSGLARRSTIWLFHDTWMEGADNPMKRAIADYAAAENLIFDDARRECHGLGVMSDLDGIKAFLECELRF